MRAGEAKAIARQWVRNAAAKGAELDGAFLHGSITWTEADDELADASDVDIVLVPTEGTIPTNRGKVTVRGVALDISEISRAQLGNAEAILGAYHLASSFRSAENILFDCDGWLSYLQSNVGTHFAEAGWVRVRCDHAVQRSTENLAQIERAGTDFDRAISTLFGIGVTTHVLLVAGLRNPTVRNRYAAAKAMLGDLGHSEMYPALIDMLDPRRTTADEAASFVDDLEILFDFASLIKRTPFHFAPDISASGRIGAIEASRELIAQGLAREAMFWIGVTASRCMALMAADGTPEDRERFRTAYQRLIDQLGIASREDATRRGKAVLEMLPVIRAKAERLILERF